MALKKLIPTLIGAALALALSACDEAEQGRILHYEKGTYLGKTDSGLSDAQLDELRARAMMQSGG